MLPVLLFGGRSAEHSVSVSSAASVAAALLSRGTTPFLLGIGRNGRLLHFPHAPHHLTTEDWEGLSHPASLHYEGGAPLTLSAEGVPPFQPQIILSLLHGKYGEDGCWQGLLTLANTPFVGCGVLSSALCMHKAKAKALAAHHGIPTAPYLVVENPSAESLAEIGRALSYPLFVKPLCGGSSLGVSRVDSAADLRAALRLALSFDEKAIVEEEIAGTELTVGVLEKNGRLLLSPVGELRTEKGFFDYDKKYKTHTTAVSIPALLSSEEERRVRDTASLLFRLMDCRGLARVDFLRSKKGPIYFNEINTIPGFTADSLFPRLFAHIGIDPLSFLLEEEE